LIIAIPTGGGSLAASTALRAAARELLVNMLATGASLLTFDMATALGLPPWVATLLSMGVGFTITVVGTRFVIQRLDASGAPVGEPRYVDIDPTEPTVPAVPGSLAPDHPEWPVLRDGSQFDPATGKLKPNVRYQTGEHDYIYTTDEYGRIVSWHADDLQFKVHDGRLNHDPNTPGKQTGDEAGHLAADRFGGSPALDNLVSQLYGVNRSDYRILENQWATALEQGKKVSVDVRVTTDPITGRPIKFDVNWTIDGQRYSQTIFNN